MNREDGYNGWSNYPTWLVNMEIVDDEVQTLVEDGERFESVRYLAQHLSEFAAEYVINDDDLKYTVIARFASAFLGMVNWYELADAHASDHPFLIGSPE